MPTTGTSPAACSQSTLVSPLTLSVVGDTELLQSVLLPANAFSLCRKEVKAAALSQVC